MSLKLTEEAVQLFIVKFLGQVSQHVKNVVLYNLEGVHLHQF